MTILVTGSRGRVGRDLVNALHAAGHPVRAASSDPTTVDLPADVPVVHCALAEPDSLPAALADVRTVFLYAEPAGITDFVTAADKAGVEHVVLLSSSSVTEPNPETDPIAVRHLDVERALTEAPFLSTFLRPGAFATNSLQWSAEIKATGAVVLPYPNSMSAPIDDTDISAVAAKLITEPAGRGKAYTLTGPAQLSLADQIGIIGDALGTQVTITPIEPEAALVRLVDRVGPDFAGIILDLWRKMDDQPAEITSNVADLLGRPARTFAQWAEANRAAFQPTSN